MNPLLKGKVYDGKNVVDFIESFKKTVRVTDTSVTVENAGMYLEQQLRFILPEIFKQKYPARPLLEILGVDNSGAWMQSIIRRIRGFSGEHKISHEIAAAKGVITLNTAAREQAIFDFKASSEYNHKDLMRAIMLNENIDSSIFDAHNQSYATVIDRIGFKGVSGTNGELYTEGLGNYSDIISGLRLDSESTFQEYATAGDGLGMYKEIAKLYNAIVGKASGNSDFLSRVCVTSPTVFSLIATTPFMVTPNGGITTDTVMTYAQKVLNLTFFATNQLIGMGSGSTDRLILLNNDMTNMRLYIPNPLMFAPVTIKGFDYSIESKFSVAGVGINFNNSIGYLDNVAAAV